MISQSQFHLLIPRIVALLPHLYLAMLVYKQKQHLKQQISLYCLTSF